MSLARMGFVRRSAVLACVVAVALPDPREARGECAFCYPALQDPLISASLSIDVAELTAHPDVFGNSTNMLMLIDLTTGLPPLDLTEDLFGTASFPAPADIDLGPAETGVFSVEIDAAFFPALEQGRVGLWALFTDTDDAVFAIDSIFLTLETTIGTFSPYYGSPNDGYRLGIADNAFLPGPLPDSLAATGTGFDEPISSKAIHVPEPTSGLLLITGLLLLGRRRCAAAVRRNALHPGRARRRGLTTAVALLIAAGLLPGATRAQQEAALLPADMAGATRAFAIEKDRPDAAAEEFLGAPAVPGEVLVIFRPLRDVDGDRQFLADIGADEIAYYEHVRVHHVRTPPGFSVAETVVLLAADPLVEAVSPNYIYHPAEHLKKPNDPSYSRQWYLNNSGRNMEGDPRVPAGRQIGIIDADIDAPQAWEHSTDCSKEVVAVFDGGVDINHPDFGGPFSTGGNIWENPVDNLADGSDGDNNGVVDDLYGANFTPDERHSERRERHLERHERVADSDGSGTLTAADTIYWDADFNDAVSNGDVAIAGPAQANGTALFALPATARHTENVAADGRFNAGESIYLDANGNNQVDAAEQPAVFGANVANGTALVAFAVANGVLDRADSIINDADHTAQVSAPDQILSGPSSGNGAPMFLFGPLNRHSENVAANGVFDDGESVYNDADNNNQVSAGDGLLFGPAQAMGTALINMLSPDGLFAGGESVYTEGDGDHAVSAADTLRQGPALNNGAVLVRFAANEKHAENVNANGVFDGGEAIYRDNDNSNTVSVGDTLLSGPAQGNGTALLPLGQRPDNVITDVTGHGTNVAGVIGARGNNGLDITGVCWRARIMTVKIATARGAEAADFCAGVNYVIDWKRNRGENVRLVNYSFGGFGFSNVVRACIAAAGNEEILFLIAAGNDMTDNDPDGQYSEAIYRDNDGNGMVNAGDTRITAFGQPGSVLPAGAVGGGDADVGAVLTRIDVDAMGNPTRTRHDETVNANGQFDSGERLYIDLDNNNSVSAGDTRLAFFESGGVQYGRGPVVAGDPDVGRALVNFNPNERFVDRDFGSSGPNGLPEGQAAVFPCAFNLSNIICVGASTNRDRLTNFSAWGLRSVDVNAPGLDILTLRRDADGGGVEYVPGTSFATPIVTGICAHFWSLMGFENYSIPELRQRILEGFDPVLNIAHAHGVDPRFGLRQTVVSGINHDGRARMVSGDDWGDAPMPYPTQMPPGARHEDCGNEWLGRRLDNPYYGSFGDEGPAGSDVSPEFQPLDCCWPADPDGTGNLVDNDGHDDGIDLLGPFTFSPVGGPANTAKVRVWVSVDNNEDDLEVGGRYPDHGGMNQHDGGDGVHGPMDDKHVWVNGWFDWNRDGDWDDDREHVFMLIVNPVLFRPDKSGVYELEFNMPQAPAAVQGGEVWARFRLDYGENCGQSLDPANLTHMVGPSAGGMARYWDDPNGLPLYDLFVAPNRYESIQAFPPGVDAMRGVAEFGEVEDYLVSTQEPDQLHLLGPLPNDVLEGQSAAILATVEDNFNGISGKQVTFEFLLGDSTFDNGTGAGSGTTTLTTDNYGQALAQFTAGSPGIELVRVSVNGTSLVAYVLFEVQPDMVPGPLETEARRFGGPP